jgi:hypothetical protein
MKYVQTFIGRPPTFERNQNPMDKTAQTTGKNGIRNAKQLCLPLPNLKCKKNMNDLNVLDS